MRKIKAGIIGGAGYTGGELIRLLLHHPHVEIAFVQSNSHANQPLHKAHHDLLGLTNLNFSKTAGNNIDVLFLCTGHNAARQYLTDNHVPQHIVIIDLSQDFRHKDNHQFKDRKFVYGLPEINSEKIKIARNIANPGCFATSIELALLPAAKNQILNTDIHINAITGSTGAGQTLSSTSHFSWRFANHSIYKPFEHQHLKEIKETILTTQPNFSAALNFIPQRGNFARGIMATIYFETNKTLDEITDMYQQFYQNQPFVHISPYELDVKQVVNTNNCFIHITKHNDNVLITSVIDNLIKGASGQAVQNMNLIFNFNQTDGLTLKPSAF